MRTLLDTHAWVWWAAEDRRLSRKARAAITLAQREQDLWLSLISVWEIAKKVATQQLVLDRPLDQWLDLAMTLPGLHLAEVAKLCECATDAGVFTATSPPNTCSYTCTGGARIVTSIKVTTSKQFGTLDTFPGVPSTINLSRSVTMRLGE